ncbi:MAG: hypothetical protein IPI00_12295 [Flavobacteriales bacterium]|nr:hypothetical protein [Flavobacteriales bacterium]MBK6943190.1 hypothetical protein [Flavobacteriales bacterium]MBK7240929.1 hypothetical protein [Flavobacteriales bacterium]MBK7296466.1 hypothetical protein [Flavobacteriales bacterium]MBK9536280.1 hypothetical protein [Flavobacteriales bacterium]
MTEIKENVPLEVIRKSPALHETIAFWFSDRDHLRSPFPPEIREELTEKAAVQFHKWVNLLDPKAKGEVDDEVIGEKIEEIIFACAMELVTDVEQRITIRYPFMPRPGDPITSSDGAESKVIARKIEKEGKDGFLMVLARETGSSKEWSTRFELP